MISLRAFPKKSRKTPLQTYKKNTFPPNRLTSTSNYCIFINCPYICLCLKVSMYTTDLRRQRSHTNY